MDFKAHVPIKYKVLLWVKFYFTEKQISLSGGFDAK